jgi:hypothetical protein
MAIARFENISVNNVVSAVSIYGEYTTEIEQWFVTCGVVQDVTNAMRISEKYREYFDLVNITVNYTPNIKTVVNAQSLYSITWRGIDWRISDIRESNDRMKVSMVCYRNDPDVAV